MILSRLTYSSIFYLWQTEQQWQYPGHYYEVVTALGCTASVRPKGAADRIVAVHCHGHDHIGGSEHAEDLEVLHQSTQEIRTRETAPGVPDQLRQHLEKNNRRREEGDLSRGRSTLWKENEKKIPTFANSMLNFFFFIVLVPTEVEKQCMCTRVSHNVLRQIVTVL